MCATDNFELRQLDHTKYMFTPDELAKLLKYGAWVTSLDSGRSIPTTERQKHFIKVCSGETEPKTDFEFLWLRYKETIQTDQMLSGLIEETSRLQHHANYLRGLLSTQTEEAKIKMEELYSSIKTLETKLFSYEPQPGIFQPETKDTSPDYSTSIYSTSDHDWREQP